MINIICCVLELPYDISTTATAVNQRSLLQPSAQPQMCRSDLGGKHEQSYNGWEICSFRDSRAGRLWCHGTTRQGCCAAIKTWCSYHCFSFTVRRELRVLHFSRRARHPAALADAPPLGQRRGGLQAAAPSTPCREVATCLAFGGTRTDAHLLGPHRARGMQPVTCCLDRQTKAASAQYLTYRISCTYASKPAQPAVSVPGSISRRGTSGRPPSLIVAII